MQTIASKTARNRRCGRWRIVGALLLWMAQTGAIASTGTEERLSRVQIDVEPADAIVLFNRVHQGPAPAMLSNVPAGEHLVVAQRRGYREKRRTIRLQPGQDLRLSLEMEPLTGLVLVHSSPEGADIEINGAHQGQTPALITDLVFGKYRVELSKQGHRSRQVELAIEDRTPKKIDVDLISDTARLQIASEPAGATVHINGLNRGQTPLEVDDIPEGETRVQVHLDGYHPYDETLRLSAGDRRHLNISLPPVPSTLTVVSVPPGARIYVDDEYRGEAPVTLEELEPKSYRVRAELPDHAILARTVRVPRAAEITEEFRLQANVGSLQIVTRPPGVSVIIDGNVAGQTRGAGDTSEPLIIEDVPMGERNVLLRARGRHEKRFTVQIERGRTTEVRHELERQFTPDYEVRMRTGAVLRGELDKIEADGTISLEIAPGVFRTFRRAEIRSHRALNDN